jgi:hypothetical protein
MQGCSYAGRPHAQCTLDSAVRKLRQTGGELPKGLRVRIKTEKNSGTDPTILTHIKGCW